MYTIKVLHNNKIRSVLALLGATALFLSGCAGDTDGGSAGQEDFAGSEFVATDANTGSINLSLASSTIAVGDVAGFSVGVKDAGGNAVSNISVSCDTEQGLAIIEPLSGSELTDSSGNMSGVIGCEAPGSFQIGCRLPIGANKRKFATVICSGTVPTGFQGFGETSGGGLGGGTGVNEDGGVGGGDTSGVRISSVLISDDGGASEGSSVDIAQGLCNAGDANETSEPFFDSLVRLTVVNNTNQAINFTGFTYSVPNAMGGVKFNSSRQSLIGTAGSSIDADGGETTIQTFFADADSGSKVFKGAGSTIDAFGLRNVTFRLYGTNGLGDEVRVSATKSLSFDDFDRCSE